MTINRIREDIDPAALTLDPENANVPTEHRTRILRESMQKTGPGRSITLDRNNAVITGNQVTQMAVELDIPITIVESYGDTLIAHKRMDLDLSQPDGPARMMALFDNLSTEQREWEVDMLVKYHQSGTINLFHHFQTDQLRQMGIDADTLPSPLSSGGSRRRYIPALPEGYLQEGAAKITFPGQRFQCGDHILIVGQDTLTGEAAVMIYAWEVFTGSKAIPIEDEA